MNITAFDNHPNSFFSVSGADKTLLWMNVKAETLVARSSKIMIGKPVTDLGAGFDRLTPHIEQCFKSKVIVKGQNLPIINRLGDGHTCEYLVYASGDEIVIMLSENTGMQSTDIDVNQSVIMLGRMLAHELKNPLAGIQGAAQLLEGSLQTAEDVELTDLIITESKRISRLADRMESFGVGDRQVHAHFNLHAALRKAKILFEAQDAENESNHKCMIAESYDPSLPDVYGNEDALMQVIVNLVGNARDAIQQAGRAGQITLKTIFKSGVSKRLQNGCTQKLSFELQVIDDGPGISMDMRERIFQPFVTSKANGQGLGLALVSKIVDDHNGILNLQSKPEETVFSILLPIDKPIAKTIVKTGEKDET